MNRLPSEQNGGQANGWGLSVSSTQFLVYVILLIGYTCTCNVSPTEKGDAENAKMIF